MSLSNQMLQVLRWRFLKFALVGASGTVVNTAVLWFAQEWLLRAIEPPLFRLNFSQAVAIFIATVNNFAWNRGWTWADRDAHQTRSVLRLFGQYTASAGVAIAIQFVITKSLAGLMHYLLANLIAIALSSVFNYLFNDRRTFRNRRRDETQP